MATVAVEHYTARGFKLIRTKMSESQVFLTCETIKPKVCLFSRANPNRGEEEVEHSAECLERSKENLAIENAQLKEEKNFSRREDVSYRELQFKMDNRDGTVELEIPVSPFRMVFPVPAEEDEIGAQIREKINQKIPFRCAVWVKNDFSEGMIVKIVV